MARLYPPITEEALPAFCLTYNSKGEKVGATIKVNFNLNRAVANSEISGIALRLRTISTNVYVVSENLAGNLGISSGLASKSEGYAISYDLEKGVCIFTISSEYNPEDVEKLKVGQYYKAQIAFVNQNQVIGYWSTVATIKCVAKPTIKIANFQFDDINSFSNEIVGEYYQDITMGDYTEKVYSYRFQLFDKDGETILEDTGDKLHNSNRDIESNASVDTYYCYRDLDENEIYYIQYHVKTINGLKLSTPRYQLMNIGSIPPEQDLKLNVFNGLETNYFTKLNWRPWEEGVMEISLDFDYDAPGKKLTGNFVLLRSSSKDNFVTWQEVRRFRLNNTEPSSKIIYDYTIEQGINYKYAIQQYNFQRFYSNKLYKTKNSFNKYNKDFAQPVKADFEDMFLYDGKKQLKIRFNPKVSSFKNDIQEQKIDTIGGKYPFIFRNGIVCYKEFPISGLISFQDDNALFFIDEDDKQQMDLERFDHNSRSEFKRGQTYSKTDLTSENITTERYFKLKVLEWLTDGKPKLFRSPTEGNYIVRLLNVSLTPQDQLGRMIHTFSCTAYEIAEFNYESLIELGLLTINEPESLEFQWESQNIEFFLSSSSQGIQDNNGDIYYSVDVGEKKIYGFSCTGFLPGDKIKILIKDEPTPIIITIGQTGSYIYENAAPIINFSVCPLPKTESSSRDLFFKLMGYNYQKFDLIASMNLFTQKGEQIVGESPNIFEKVVVNNSHNINNYFYGKDAKKYYETNNVYLSEDFEPVQIDEETYNKNLYYILEPDGTYSFCYDEMERKPYNSNKIYCKRIFNAPKIVTSDILYLHAKRREVIPIFAYTTTSIGENGDTIYVLDNKLNQGLIEFQLTPFGNGYLYGKNISPDWLPNLYNTLTEEERVMALKVEDLVTFVINKCNLDIFCLFEVYVPKLNEENNSLEWQPYKDLNISTSSYSGIYDPYLYQKTGNGWWTEDKVYDPSFTIGFGEDKDYTEKTISLEDTIEIILKDIELPTYLANGTGVMMEIFYRLKYIDYTIENTEPIIKNKKKILLSTIADAQHNKALYRTQTYYQAVNNSLTEKEKQTWAAIANSSEEYADTIETITELARTAQIATIKSYLNKEAAAMKILLNQCQAIDQNLSDILGSSDFIFYKKLNTAQDNYFNYINQIINKNNDNLLPLLSNYKNQTVTISTTENELQNYYNNNSSSIISIIRQQILKDTLQSGYKDCKEEIALLNDKQYVAQYLELLEEKAKIVFFKQPSNINGNEELVNWIQQYTIAEWVNKKDGFINLKSNADIFDDESWNEYFHIIDSFPLLNSIRQDEESKQYVIDNLNDFSNIEEININQNAKIFTEKFEDNKTLLEIISEKLLALNNESHLTSTEYEDKWEISWNSTQPKSFELFSKEVNSQINFMNLGQLNYDASTQTYSINKSILEEQIDNAFGLGILSYNSTKEDIITFLQGNEYGKDFPLKLKQSLADIIYIYISSWRERFQNMIGFIEYLSSPQNIERLSNDQIKFIQDQLENYYRDTNSTDSSWYQKLKLSNSSSDFQKFYTINNLSFEQWYKDYNGITSESSIISNSINEIMKYVDIFNQILQIKQNAIQEFKTIKTKIDNLKNKSGLNSSDNIKIILYEEQDAYQNAYYEVEQALNYFENRQEKLRTDYEYNSYLEFLKDYLTLDEATKQSSIDKNYRQFIQKASLITEVELGNNPKEQNSNVTNAWMEFLKVLASTYKKIEEKGKIS